MSRGLALASVLSVSLLGCGHPASQEECEKIFTRSAEIELQMQNVTDPKVLSERMAAARKDRGDELIKGCVGKRITEQAMSCILSAKSTEAIDKCLD